MYVTLILAIVLQLLVRSGLGKKQMSCTKQCWNKQLSNQLPNALGFYSLDAHQPKYLNLWLLILFFLRLVIFMKTTVFGGPFKVKAACDF